MRLGPWLVVLFLLDRAILPQGQPSWRRLLPPSVAIVAACLANPYGVRGLRFPLELYPKLTAAGGVYKQYIDEFMSPRTMVEKYWSLVPGRDLYLRLYVFLLAVVPMVALSTSLWRTWSSARPEESDPGEARVWLLSIAWPFGLAMVVAAGLPGPATPPYRIAIGGWVPWVLVSSGVAAALALGRRSRLAAMLAVAGTGSIAAWLFWLVNQLERSEAAPVAAAMALGLGLPVAFLSIRAGSRPFGWFVAASFAYLSLLAVRNMSLFGLIAGGVLAGELGEWAAQLGFDRNHGSRAAVVTPRLIVLGVVLVLAASVVSDRFYSMTEECHHFGLRERPFYYAHDACRFASRPGLPERALTFGLNQAGVYEFHDAPARQVFIDGRLEVASRNSFALYVWIQREMLLGSSRWKDVVRRMGNPLILIDHEDNRSAEATLLADPDWRCVYLDAVASIFLPRSDSEPGRSWETAYPTIDFAGWHFHQPKETTISLVPGSVAVEAQALVRLGVELAHRPVPAWSLRIPIELVAMDRAWQSIDESPRAVVPWITLGHAAMGLVDSAATIPNGSADRAPWDPALDLAWAQASAAYREALRRDPLGSHPEIRQILAATYRLREMNDAVPLALDTASDLQSASPSWPGEPRLADVLATMLREGKPAGAVALAHEARRRSVKLSWPVADRVAAALLHLGEPSAARRIWLDAGSPPSAAIRAARLADADLAAWKFADARDGYKRALALDSNLTDAWIGLALIGLEQGRAPDALEAAHAALANEPAPPRRALLEGIVSLCETQSR